MRPPIFSSQFLGRKPSADFSSDWRFRWFLRWPTGLIDSRAMFCIGANPSQAGKRLPDGTILSDNTISRLVSLARTLGYGQLWMANARSFVSTDPKGVPPDPEGIGNETDYHIEWGAKNSDLVVCCYGHLASERAARVLELVRKAGKVPHALALTKDGTPRHPRGVPASARPFAIPKLRDLPT